MSNNLYINGEYVTSLSQLRSYFTRPVVVDSPLYDELLTYAVDGLITEWLERGDVECQTLARSLRGLKYDNVDDKYFNSLVALFTGHAEEVVKYKATDYLELQTVQCHSGEKEIPLSGNPSSLSGEIEVPEDMAEKAVRISATFKVKRTGNAAFSIGLESDGKRIAVSQSEISLADKKVNAVLKVESSELLTVSRQGCEITLSVNDEVFCHTRINLNSGRMSFTVGAVNFTMVKVDSKMSTNEVSFSSYYIGEVPVTQALWQAVMGDNPSFFNGRIYGTNLQRPVEFVSWDDCQMFIKKLNEKLASQLNGKRFRLPTEAEWEFSARGGTKSKHYKYAGSDNIDAVAWYDGNSGGQTHPVGEKVANELGLYDMSGNVWELCQNYFSHIDKGGSCYSFASDCLVSCRLFSSLPSSDTGLRLALSEKPSTYITELKQKSELIQKSLIASLDSFAKSMEMKNDE